MSWGGPRAPACPPTSAPDHVHPKKRKNSIYLDAFFLRDGSMRTFPSAYWSLRPLPSGAETGEASRGPRPQEIFFFFSPSLNNIYIFSLNNKTINILALFNLIFWFRPWLPSCIFPPGEAMRRPLPTILHFFHEMGLWRNFGLIGINAVIDWKLFN